MTTSSLYGSSSLTKTVNSIDNLSTLSIIAIVIAICGAITLYYTLLSKRNEGKVSGVLAILYETFTFKKFWIKPLLKVTYLIATIYITIMSFGMIQLSVKLFFMMLIGGNLLIRLNYELLIMFVKIFENSRNLSGKGNNMQVNRPPVPPQRPVQQAQVVQQPMQQPVRPVQPIVQQPVQPQQPPKQEDTTQNPVQ